ncbi:hypothetical protein QJS04_geneDACA006221 [Acorus gramineus]|uniref:Cupin type-1 domain-containing protein n=1 Tax=Acorus gramineus TaxID=55184 RepID=A0AAV9AVG9_ACOGR|nr:hypothetical protein QJS04_geneDACA006221 [Acorus gramineus]
MAFRVSPEVIQGIKSIEATPSIIPCSTKNKTEVESGRPNWKEGIVEALIGGRRGAVDLDPNKSKKKKKKKTKISNLLSMKPDFENCNGWSLSVTGKDLQALRGSSIGIFMVNLTKGSMMSPHWNPRASEIAIVTYGQGMVQVVCSGNNLPLSGDGKTRCRNMRFKVKEGDVFVVPRYYPMAEISFNNDSLVFMGFSTMARKNRPQFLAGGRSVLQMLDPNILAMSFNVANTTVSGFLASQEESVVLDCTSCAESAEKLMEEEEEEAKGGEEEGKRHEEEEKAKKREAREEEKERGRGREEEEAGREEEEEQQRQRERQEEEQEQKQRGWEEEEARREEEEQREREEEEREEGGGGKEEGEHESEEEQEARSKEEEGKHREGGGGGGWKRMVWKA